MAIMRAQSESDPSGCRRKQSRVTSEGRGRESERTSSRNSSFGLVSSSTANARRLRSPPEIPLLRVSPTITRSIVRRECVMSISSSCYSVPFLRWSISRRARSSLILCSRSCDVHADPRRRYAAYQRVS